jgi:hypothetical protein
MHVGSHSVHNSHMRLLVEAELPHHPENNVLLHGHVEHQGRLRLLVVLVSEAQRQKALWCAGCDSHIYVWHPLDVVIRESRTDRRSPCMPSSSGREPTRTTYKGNVNPKCKLSKQNVEANWKSKVSTYRPQAPQRAHGETVGGVVALW